jgi:hypothetical protein
MRQIIAIVLFIFVLSCGEASKKKGNNISTLPAEGSSDAPTPKLEDRTKHRVIVRKIELGKPVIVVYGATYHFVHRDLVLETTITGDDKDVSILADLLDENGNIINSGDFYLSEVMELVEDRGDGVRIVRPKGETRFQLKPFSEVRWSVRNSDSGFLYFGP